MTNTSIFLRRKWKFGAMEHMQRNIFCQPLRFYNSILWLQLNNNRLLLARSKRYGGQGWCKSFLTIILMFWRRSSMRVRIKPIIKAIKNKLV